MSVQLVAFLLATLFTSQAYFLYFDSNMIRIFDYTTVPKYIIPMFFQPKYVCCLLSSNNTVQIKRSPYDNSGSYYWDEDLPVVGTGVFCTNSRDSWGNKTFLLNTAQELKVFYRPSSLTVHKVLTTLPNFTSTSLRIETNTDGTMIGTVDGNNIRVWVEDPSVALKYRMQTIPMGEGLVDMKFCANGTKILAATASQVELWAYDWITRSYSQVYTTNVSMLLIALIDISDDCAIISLAAANRTVQILLKDPENLWYYQMKPMIT